MRKVVPLNCSQCGRFIGKDGYVDVIYDDYAGGYEAGYSYCGRCLQEREPPQEQGEEDE